MQHPGTAGRTISTAGELARGSRGSKYARAARGEVGQKAQCASGSSCMLFVERLQMSVPLLRAMR